MSATVKSFLPTEKRRKVTPEMREARDEQARITARMAFLVAKARRLRRNSNGLRKCNLEMQRLSVLHGLLAMALDGQKLPKLGYGQGRREERALRILKQFPTK